MSATKASHATSLVKPTSLVLNIRFQLSKGVPVSNIAHECEKKKSNISNARVMCQQDLLYWLTFLQFTRLLGEHDLNELLVVDLPIAIDVGFPDHFVHLFMSQNVMISDLLR